MRPSIEHIGSIPDLLRYDQTIGQALISCCSPIPRSSKRETTPRSAGSYSLVPIGGGLATTISPEGLRFIPDVPPCSRRELRLHTCKPRSESQEPINLFRRNPNRMDGTAANMDHFDTRVQFCNAQKRTDELKSHLCWNSNSSVNGLKVC
jgi:hypothetical protein